MRHTSRPYEGASNKTQKCVDESWEAVKNVLVKHGFKAANDDRAEDLVDAIHHYLKASNPERNIQ